jgi:hypothetical protein
LARQHGIKFRKYSRWFSASQGIFEDRKPGESGSGEPHFWSALQNRPPENRFRSSKIFGQKWLGAEPLARLMAGHFLKKWLTGSTKNGRLPAGDF